MRTTSIAVVCLLVSLLFPLTVTAKTGYVSDILVVMLRSSTSNDHQVLERLTSNTPVTILAEEGGFYRVRTRSGTEGFILKQYITDDIPKTAIIEQLQAEIKTLKSDHTTLQNRLTSIQEASSDQTNIDELMVQLEEARSKLQQMTKQYESLRESSADVIQLHENNQFLEEQNQLLSRELVVLREENSSFHRSNMIQWFLAGAGVFIGGWLIGKISRQKPRGFSR